MAARPVSLRFALESADGVSRISWRGPAPYQANQLVERPPSEEEHGRRQMDRHCQAFLRDLLGTYGMPVQAVKNQCAAAGFSLRTTERAANKLQLVLMRKYEMNMWFLPKADGP